MRVLGISCFFHAAAAALVCDGRVVAAAEEERFSRVKHDSRFPEQAITFCLRKGGLAAGDLDDAVFYEKPFVKFERILSGVFAYSPGTSLGERHRPLSAPPRLSPSCSRSSGDSVCGGCSQP